jgi:hypothetical protein
LRSLVRIIPEEMISDDDLGNWLELSIIAIGALYPRFSASSLFPFISAGRLITAFSGALTLKPSRVHILSTSEQIHEDAYFGIRI